MKGRSRRLDLARPAAAPAIALGLALLCGLPGCAANDVRVDAGDAERIAQVERIAVEIADPGALDPAPASPGPGGAIPEALAASLRDEAERALRAKGYTVADAAGNAGGAEVVLLLAGHRLPTRVRSWSSDPDASAARLVEREEAVLALRARRRDDGEVIWRADARATLPEPERPFGPDAEATWSRLLDDALARVPQRR